MAKVKKIQKSIYFDPDVLKALEKQMKVSHNSNFSVIVNDGLRYAMFPEHRSDRDADMTKLYHQMSYSLAQHRKKTGRDVAILQEMMLQMMKNFYLHNGRVPEAEMAAREADANVRLDEFMEGVVRDMGSLKLLPDEEGQE